MNERIIELANKAGAEVKIIHGDILYISKAELDIEKFAELIVRECMTTMLKESKWYWDKDEFESSNAIQNATRRVKEHFGVEE